MLDLRSWQARIVFGTVALLIAFFLFFPIYWLVISALKTDAELYRLRPTLFPETLTLTHFGTALFRATCPPCT